MPRRNMPLNFAELFAAAYVEVNDAGKAYAKALNEPFKPSFRPQGLIWLAKGEVKRNIKRLLKTVTRKVEKKARLSRERVLESIAQVIEADVRRLFDESGNLRPIAELDENEAALVAGFDTVVRNVESGDGHTDKVWKIRLTDRAKWVEMAAKHYALLTEKHEVEIPGLSTLVDRLAAGRKRVAEANAR